MSQQWTTMAVRGEQSALLRALHLNSGSRNDKPTRVNGALLKKYLKRQLKDKDIGMLLQGLERKEGRTFDHLDFSDYK